MLVGCASKGSPLLHPLRPRPPIVLFDWYNRTTGDNGHTVGPPFFLPVGLDESLAISIKASDNGGLDMVSFSGGESWRCRDGTTVTTGNRDYPGWSQTFNPSLQSFALPVAFISPDNWDCPSGAVVVDGSAQLEGHAVGYWSLQSQAELNIDFRPKASP
jgi:hypothetical protein